MTEPGTIAQARPLSWPRAAIGAALFIGMMTVLLVVIPNQFVTSDPSRTQMIITIIYVVAVFALVALLIAAWQNRTQAVPQAAPQRISAFGRPMRQGPGFASFAEKLPTAPPSRRDPVKVTDTGSAKNTSSFGRPLKKRSK
ncbi:MAG: hypothetical protein U9N79_01355 [Actinomycetota bacterium]|nr:hypothetical protein [Actinomycetota bacterium]